MSYVFREFTLADAAMVGAWLQTPEVARWWGDPEYQLELLTEDLDAPQMRQWIVAHEGRDFAYVQAYPAQAWAQPHLMRFAATTEAVDAFIGVPEMLGQGHGSRFLNQFARMLVEGGAAGVVIDPDEANERAIAAYARAGFVGDEVVEGGEGPVVLMVFPG